MSVIIQQSLLGSLLVTLDEGPGMRQQVRAKTLDEAVQAVRHYYADRREEDGRAHLRTSVLECPICHQLAMEKKLTRNAPGRRG